MFSINYIHHSAKSSQPKYTTELSIYHNEHQMGLNGITIFLCVHQTLDSEKNYTNFKMVQVGHGLGCAWLNKKPATFHIFYAHTCCVPMHILKPHKKYGIFLTATLARMTNRFALSMQNCFPEVFGAIL